MRYLLITLFLTACTSEDVKINRPESSLGDALRSIPALPKTNSKGAITKLKNQKISCDQAAEFANQYVKSEMKLELEKYDLYECVYEVNDQSRTGRWRISYDSLTKPGEDSFSIYVENSTQPKLVRKPGKAY